MLVPWQTFLELLRFSVLLQQTMRVFGPCLVGLMDARSKIMRVDANFAHRGTNFIHVCANRDRLHRKTFELLKAVHPLIG